MLLLGIDVGTTGVKAAVFDETGVQKGYAFQEYNILRPLPDYAEQDAEDIWCITKKIIKSSVKGFSREIKTLSLSVQGDAVIAVDSCRNAISPAQLGMDYRGREESRFCAEQFGEEYLFQKTGIRPHPMNSIIKILWIRNHQLDLYEKAYKFVTYADFILGKLGSDQLVIDYSMASRTMAFDAVTHTWSDEILSALNISKEKLSTPVPSGTIVGSLSPSLAAELGMEPGTKLVSGGHDQPCAALGAGIIQEDMALDSHGSAEVLSTVFTNPQFNATMFHSYYPRSIHVIPNLYFTFSLNHTGGVSLKWFVENFCQQDIAQAVLHKKQVYNYIIEHFPKAPASVMVLPHFNGRGTPTCDLEAKGAFLGLTLSTDRFEIAKSILEALSYELKLNLDHMQMAGISIHQLRAVGGGARSPVGLQNKADILGIPVTTLKIREAACFGAAMLAGLACSVYKTPQDTANVVIPNTTYYPDWRTNSIYKEKYEVYSTLYRLLKNIPGK